METIAHEASGLNLTADVVAAFISNNTIAVTELPQLINDVHRALQGLNAPPVTEPEKPTPAVPIRSSIRPDYIVSLFDGKKLKTLKRHLRTEHNMTPAEYRRYWGLPADYPMVAPNYAASRSELAKKMGLGRLAGQARGGRGARTEGEAAAPAKGRRQRKAA